MIKEAPACKNFTGYKPCFGDHNCYLDGCKNCEPVGTKILIINLDAMGDVLMTTAQLPGIKRKFPQSTIYWLTLKNASPLLLNNHLIDKVLDFDFASLLILEQIEFDYIMNVDKSQQSCSVLNKLNAKNKLGFGLDKNGKIIPVNAAAMYNYNLGMDDNLKFKLNTKTGEEYLAETFELDYQKDEYVFNFSSQELKFIEEYKQKTGIKNSDNIVGFNTGCSNLYPNKKMTIAQHVQLIDNLLKKDNIKIMLLGGIEDKERNEEIASHFNDRVINTPTNQGLRKGACFESIPQIIVTGDSFGMHLAIALKKYVIAWFGLSCWTEIELFGRGIKLFPKDLECSPCWKKDCPFDLECMKMINLELIVSEINSYFKLK